MCEVSVIVKDSDRTYKQKFLSYDADGGEVFLSNKCLKLKAMVDEAKSNFKEMPEEIIVKTRYVWYG